VFKKLGLADRILLVANFFVALLLLLSFLSQFTDPSLFWFIAILGLAFPGLALTNLVFTLYWTMKLRPQLFISLLTLIISSAALPKHFQISENNEEGDLKVLSFNAQVFDHYYWKQDSSKRQKIYDFLREEEFDIICFQEYFESRRPYYKNFNDTLKAATGLEYSQKEYAVDFYGNLFGLAIFSRYPILSTGKLELPKQGTNICIYSDLLIDQDTVRVYNMHLASLHLDQENYELLDNLDKGLEEQNLKAMKGLLKRLRGAYKRRKEQVDPIAAHVSQSPYPLILCGDFNDGPVSYTYRNIADGLFDSFIQAGKGFGNTYNGRLPALRIDYILHSNDFVTSQHKVVNQNLSDHFPVVAELKFNSEN